MLASINRSKELFGTERLLSRVLSFIGTLLVLLLSIASSRGAEHDRRPDVLFIAIDDMSDWIQLLDENAPIQTPNLERLVRRGTLFTRAYCASPACNPSRTAVLTGKRPSSSGVYGNMSDWRKVMPNRKTLMQSFMDHGYYIVGAGKVFHHQLGSAFHDDQSFHEFQKMPDPPDKPRPPSKLNGLEWFGSPNTDWGRWPPKEDDHIDVRTVDFCIEKLKQRDKSQPLFLAAGIFRPHMPFYAPPSSFEEYPLEEVVLPQVKQDDLADVPPGGIKLWKHRQHFEVGLAKAEVDRPMIRQEVVQAYKAAATFADEQVGRLLDALDASPRADDTIIVLWSDHGYHLGEKRHWSKMVLWEKATHVPFVIVAPGVNKGGTRCDAAVDLTSIYPTLIELCGLKPVPDLDGVSIVPLLKDPARPWSRPAVMTYLRGNHAVRDARWRYIRYADGTEELYDHQSDPNEWTNLAGEEEYESVKERLRKCLPQKNAKAAPTLKK